MVWMPALGPLRRSLLAVCGAEGGVAVRLRRDGNQDWDVLTVQNRKRLLGLC